MKIIIFYKRVGVGAQGTHTQKKRRRFENYQCKKKKNKKLKNEIKKTVDRFPVQYTYKKKKIHPT